MPTSEPQFIVAKSASMNCRGFDATAVAATGYIHVQPLAKDSAFSTIKFDLFVETTGVIGWFIPESAVRSRQEAMVRRDLAFAQ